MSRIKIDLMGRELFLEEGSTITAHDYGASKRNDKVTIVKITEDKIEFELEILSSGEILNVVENKKKFILNIEKLAQDCKMTITL